MYDRISRYYDQSQAAFAEDIPFMLALAEQTGSPILELGCGSGRLLLPLARAGYVVTGVDSSPAMLALAEARLAQEEAAVRERVSLLPGDMTGDYLPAEAGTMALAIVGINTFMHLDEGQSLAALRQVARLLQPDGRLFIDVANPFDLANAGTEPAWEQEQEWIDTATGHVVRQLATYESVEGAQAVDVSWAFEEVAGDEAIERTESRMRYHYIYPHQFDLLLARCGLQLAALYGGYDWGQFEIESDRLLVLARPQ